MQIQTLHTFNSLNEWNQISLEAFEVDQGKKYSIYSKETPLISTDIILKLKFTLNFFAAPPDFFENVGFYFKKNFNIWSHLYNPTEKTFEHKQSDNLKDIFLKNVNETVSLKSPTQVCYSLNTVKVPVEYCCSKTCVFYSLFFGNDCFQENLVIMNKYYYALLKREKLNDFSWKKLNDVAQGIEWLKNYLANKRENTWTSLTCFNTHFLKNFFNHCHYTVQSYTNSEQSNFIINFSFGDKEINSEELVVIKSNFHLLAHSEDRPATEVQFFANSIFMIFRERNKRDGLIQLLISFYNSIGDEKFYSLEIFGRKIVEFHFVSNKQNKPVRKKM